MFQTVVFCSVFTLFSD